MRKKKSQRLVTFRRSPFAISYWISRALIFENYVTGKKVAGEPIIASVLHFCGQSRNLAEIISNFAEENPADLRRCIRSLLKYSLLEKNSQKFQQDLQKWENWAPWNPSAGYFHFSTKDTPFERGEAEDLSALKEIASEKPLPELTKKYLNRPVIQLHNRSTESEFPQVLRQRRTWRKFTSKAVNRDSLEQLLWLSFGVQGWVNVPEVGRLVLKTSPSGGALHPLEAYVAVRNVKHIGAGIYHYDSAGHRLERLQKGLGKREIKVFLARQQYFAGAAFVVFLTAVFARPQWKYKHPRAYRVVLAEAGHLCQTFCLTATWLGLAPFCTMALADTAIEKALRVDGISESVIYAMGAGVRPAKRRP